MRNTVFMITFIIADIIHEIIRDASQNCFLESSKGISDWIDLKQKMQLKLERVLVALVCRFL